MSDHTEEEYEMTLLVTVRGFGGKPARQKSASNIKRILEVNLARPVDVLIKVGKEYETVERLDRNAGDVDAGDAALQR